MQKLQRYYPYAPYLIVSLLTSYIDNFSKIMNQYR